METFSLQLSFLEKQYVLDFNSSAKDNLGIKCEDLKAGYFNEPNVQLPCDSLTGYEYDVPLLFSRWVMSDTLWPHGLQHARLPCPHHLLEFA